MKIFNLIYNYLNNQPSHYYNFEFIKEQSFQQEQDFNPTINRYLIDAINDQPITELTDGVTIYTSELPVNYMN